MKLSSHPTFKWYREQGPQIDEALNLKVDRKIDSAWLKKLCAQEGAGDVGLVSVDDDDISLAERQDLFEILPAARAVVSLVFPLNVEAIKTKVHSIANLEYGLEYKHANETCRLIVRRLQKEGIRAVNTAAGFPYEADRWPGKMWLISDKLMAQRAGLGKMGLNRLVLHPHYGAAIVLANILIDRDMKAYDGSLAFNPCLECKLCVSACPTGAIGRDGHFNFVSCYTHNYREKLGGFISWVETLADSRSAKEYRKRVGDSETLSMWQNLSIVSQTRCDRCMAVCPAGRSNIGPYISDRENYMNQTVKWMRKKKETIYVVKNSDADTYVRSTFPHKLVKTVENGVRPNSVRAFLMRLPVLFQREKSGDLDANYHFTFTGKEPCKASVRIKDKAIHVDQAHFGTPDLHLIADSATWLRFLAKEQSMMSAIVKRKIRIRGPLKLMQAFARCFP